MMRIETMILPALVGLLVMAPVAAGASEPDAPPSAPSAVTPAASPKPVKHHRRHKKITGGSAATSSPVTSASASVSNTGAIGGNMDAPGMPNGLAANNPGSPNMGSPDHTPGTTGTSGQ